MRYFAALVLALALGVMGCSETSGTVGEQCAYPDGEISPEEYEQGVRCEEGLTQIFAARLLYPCSGDEFTCVDGCSVPPPCLCFNCTPCGDGQCQCELGENACNCPEDCD